MLNPRLSTHGNALLILREMASTGYMRVDGVKVENAYDDFELRKFRKIVLPQFEEMGIKSVWTTALADLIGPRRALIKKRAECTRIF